MSWQARTKDDLAIEVWEKLDCEDVGASEIEAIETVIAAEYGAAAVDSPMLIARLLADEGAELRHSEIMELFVRRSADRPYDAAFTNLFRFDDPSTSLSTLRNVENLRLKYSQDKDRDGMRHLRNAVLAAKEDLKRKAASGKTDELQRQIAGEIVEWISHWLQTPAMFSTWVAMRLGSKDFVDRFGQLKD